MRAAVPIALIAACCAISISLLLVGVMYMQSNNSSSKQDAKNNAFVQPAPKTKATSPKDGTLLTIDPSLTLPGWGASSKRTRLSYQDGAIRIDYPAHPHAAAGGTNWTFKPPSVKLPAREASVSFDVFFPADFPFEASGSSAGKIGIGFKIGSGDASGGNWSDSGASLRLIWFGSETWGSYALGYAYVEVTSPQNFRGTFDQSSQIAQETVLTDGGANLWRPEKIKDPLAFRKGQWNSCTLKIRLNSPGQHDGSVSISVNGKEKHYDNFRWVVNGSTSRIDSFLVNSWFGGSASDPSWAPGRPCYSLLKNVRVWTAS